MGFWDGYWKSLKPLDVEEPIDVWVHRPLAYLLARAAYPTPLSPNMITIGSIALGVSAGVCMFVTFEYHLVVAGLTLFLSAVLDCADGQLARMRGTSSVFGRMLDGTADLVVSTAVVLGGTYVVWSQYREPWWLGGLSIVMCVATIVTGSFHTGGYDHYKNLFLRLTEPSFREGEDFETALERYRESAPTASLPVRFAWHCYLFYVKSQRDFIAKFDPAAAVRFAELPPFDAERARVYRAHAAGTMRLWRSWFGFGSLVFGISVSVALGVLPYYMLLRLVLLNAVFYGYLRPEQRRVTAAALAAVGVRR